MIKIEPYSCMSYSLENTAIPGQLASFASSCTPRSEDLKSSSSAPPLSSPPRLSSHSTSYPYNQDFHSAETESISPSSSSSSISSVIDSNFISLLNSSSYASHFSSHCSVHDWKMSRSPSQGMQKHSNFASSQVSRAPKSSGLHSSSLLNKDNETSSSPNSIVLRMVSLDNFQNLSDVSIVVIDSLSVSNHHNSSQFTQYTRFHAGNGTDLLASSSRLLSIFKVLRKLGAIFTEAEFESRYRISPFLTGKHGFSERGRGTGAQPSHVGKLRSQSIGQNSGSAHNFLRSYDSKPPTFNTRHILSSSNRVIILDWDDTLFPTYYLCSIGIIQGPLPTREGRQGDRPTSSNQGVVFDLTKAVGDVARALRRHDCFVVRFLKQCYNMGLVRLITNSDNGWVECCSKQLMPATWKLMKTYNIDVISARSKYANSYPVNPEKWKINAFTEEMKSILEAKKSINRLRPKIHIIAVGDTTYDIIAARHITQTFEKEAYVKLFKLVETPALDVLSRQICHICSRFEDISKYEGNKEIFLDC